MIMIEAKIEGFLERQSFKLREKQIAIGVSGGPDSLALLHYLAGQRAKRNLSIVAVHVDHMFRGQESFEDAMFVKDFCKQHDIPFEMAQINVPERMQEHGTSPEVEARAARYEFFAQVMAKYGYTYLALGHHGDDQIETILMRLTRGSTGSARAGIPFTRPFAGGVIFRPLLTLTKRELEEYCRLHRLDARIDSTNDESLYSRNRFRKQMLPFLKQENPHVHEHFQRFSEELQLDEFYLQELTVQRMNTIMTIGKNNRIELDIKSFLEMPLPLQRRGIQLILNYLYRNKPASLSAVHTEQIFHLIHHNLPSGKLDLPNGLKVIRSYLTLSFQYHLSDVPAYYFEIWKPGLCKLPNGTSIKVEYIDKFETAPSRNTAVFNSAKVKWPIIIRTRQTGERMSLKGMSGSRKIKDIFIDQKISIMDRNSWPVITDVQNTILWLPGLKKSAMEGTHPHATQYIQLEFISKESSRGHNE
jgi:tRNA(Ile)-lysidine synthase